MDYSKTLSTGDLTASSVSAYVIDESKTLESHCFIPEPPNHHPHHGGKVISDADWPTLKPIIHRLYIIDNLKFPKVKEALKSEFGYKITKRQFTRKVGSWGFKKNFRKDERDEIVKSGRIPQRLIHDSRINQKRIERLQKRYVARMGLGVESEDNERSLVQDQDFSPKTNAIKEASLDLEPCYTMTGDQNAALEDHDMTVEEIPRSEFRHDIVTQNTEDEWPFSQSAGDDSEISWLAELFVQLEIAEIITSTSFETEKEKQWDVEEARFISGTDLKALSNPYDKTLVCGGSFLAQRNNHYPHHLSTRSTSLQTHNSGIYQCRWSPLFEIDIFPPFRNSNNRIQNNFLHSLASFKRMSVDLESKLSKLERLLPANSPAIISTLEYLIFVYNRLLWKRKVAMTCRKLLYARQNERFPNTYKIVESCLGIVDSCIALGELMIGRDLHLILHPKIEEAVDSQHPLHIHSSYLMAKILHRINQDREAENIICPLMQIVLATLGHNHLLTIKVMNLLSLILKRKHYLIEANRLSRYSLQVSIQSGLGVAWFESASTLIFVLEAQDLYNESINLSHHISKLSAEALGEKLACHFHHIIMARALLQQNKDSKAVDMLKGIQNSPYANESNEIFIEVEFKGVLGNALWKQGRVWEAIVCFKESLKSTVKMYGWDHSSIFLHCKIIVNCLVHLSQYDEALRFFERFLEKCRGFVKQGSPIAGWIEETEDRMYRMRGEVEDDDNSISEDDYEEDETSFGDTEMKDHDIHEEEDDDKAQFEGRGPRLDDIFNTERDISKDITFEELGLDEAFSL
ncbi:uncharacterized protein EAE98_003046 [Botrytis deweyae]|uniref:Clr5 domain-containing protein n=1 Tax=Botrytis deweyae TaxID=2478750 RepID=A0ABQ7IVG1_9HELO|nr:uncharacterized protein EAE98_003046 [Botrytis deweyae]KAF7935001.1 hypothetical protein EAE98_003046 [Botrytis deweyae]